MRFVRNGGGLVGFHGATVLNAGPYVSFLGGSFADHPGGIRPAACDSVGTHPTVVRMAKPFNTRDEIYTFNNYNTQNQVVLTCPPLGGGAPLPIAWYRNEGTGRVFYTAMGHGNEHWTASSALVNDHVVPAILWAAGH
jgi:type 1 glutamine amidotransferase